MINLKEQAAILAHDIDKPFDFPLERRLIAMLIDGRASLLRRSITSNKAIPAECIQAFSTPIEKAGVFGAYYVDNYKVSMKTKDSVPIPIRINASEPFISVSSQDGSINYAYADIATIRSNSKGGKFVSNTGRYIYHGTRVGLYHNEPTLATMGMIMIRGLFENPLLVKDYAGLYTYSEEQFPMPMDMAIEIRQLILKGELGILPTDQTVPINDN